MPNNLLAEIEAAIANRWINLVDLFQFDFDQSFAASRYDHVKVAAQPLQHFAYGGSIGYRH